MATFDLSEKVAVVTGAGSGIGRAIAMQLAKCGARVFCVDVVEKGAEITAQTISQAGQIGKALVADISDNQQCEALSRQVADSCESVDVLVNNAAIIRRGRISDPSALDDWRATIKVDLDGPFLMTRAFLGLLRKNGGASVVNLGSTSSFAHAQNSAAYTAAKFGVAGLTKALAWELGPMGIRVNGVAPGMVETAMNADELRRDPMLRQRFLTRAPLARLGNPADIAEAVSFLASNQAAWVTGVMLPVDGGFLTI